MRTLWDVIVDHSPAENGLQFISAIVAKFAADFEAYGHLPNPLIIGMMHGSIAGSELRIIPIGDIGDKLIKLTGHLAEPKYADKFSVHSADVIDVQPEDFAVGHDSAPKPGLMLTYDGLPVLTIGGEANKLFLNMGGFKRSIIGLNDDLPALWDRVRRYRPGTQKTMTPQSKTRKPATEVERRRNSVGRREQARQRQDASGPIGQFGLSLPAMTILPQTVPAEAGSSLSRAEVLLVPIQGSKETSGPYPRRKIVEVLRNGLGVQTILADYKLRALARDRDEASDYLEDALPDTVAHHREAGITHLAAWTEFDNVGQVRTWANAKFLAPPKNNKDLRAREAAVELSAVRLLVQALEHVEHVALAYYQAERAAPEEAASIIGSAYKESPYANLTADDLFAIAVFGDLNPVPFWGLSEEHLISFEIARFIGRIQAGAQAVLLPHLQPGVLRALSSSEPVGGSNEQDQPNDPFSLALETNIRAAFKTSNEMPAASEFKKKLSNAVGINQNLVIDRRTRKMTLKPGKATEPTFDLSRIYNPLNPRGLILPIVPPKAER